VTLWLVVVVASLACLSLKLAGYLAPPSLLERPMPSRIADLLTVALLAALIAVQTVAGGSGIVLDARVPAVAVAALLLWLRVPFILVVIAAAGVAALLRALG
jgi:hypothetical protein